MKHMRIFLVILCAAALPRGHVIAQQAGPFDTVLKGCENALMTYCKDVTPGEGRVVACLYARFDKLSDQCASALLDVSPQLNQIMNTLSSTMNECRDDLQSYCSSVFPGEGRLLNCLEKNSDRISSGCKKALKEAGLLK